MLEKDLQRQIISEAEKMGYYVVKILQCNKNGFPDLLLLKDGKAMCIEVKSQGKKARPLQIYRHNELAKYGITTHVIDNINNLTL